MSSGEIEMCTDISNNSNDGTDREPKDKQADGPLEGKESGEKSASTKSITITSNHLDAMDHKEAALTLTSCKKSPVHDSDRSISKGQNIGEKLLTAFESVKSLSDSDRDTIPSTVSLALSYQEGAQLAAGHFAVADKIEDNYPDGAARHRTKANDLLEAILEQNGSERTDSCPEIDDDNQQSVDSGVAV
jgi:hypothetical protein